PACARYATGRAHGCARIRVGARAGVRADPCTRPERAGMKALVTGATGFVGAAVAQALERAGWSVRVLVRASSDRTNLARLAAEPVQGDLREPASLAAALAGCEALIHVAA